MKRSRLADFIGKRIKRLHVSRAEFARRAGVSRSELYKLLAQDVGEARLSTLARLARALEVPVYLLLNETLGGAACTPAGITEPRYTGDALAVARSDEEECASVAAGEASGQLPDVLNHLAEFVESLNRKSIIFVPLAKCRERLFPRRVHNRHNLGQGFKRTFNLCDVGLGSIRHKVDCYINFLRKILQSRLQCSAGNYYSREHEKRYRHDEDRSK